MKKRKVIIDCDPGIDDSLAIMLALKSPEIEVIGITIVCGKFTGGDGIWKCKENPEADESSGRSCVHWGKHSLKAGLRECSGHSWRRRAW